MTAGDGQRAGPTTCPRASRLTFQLGPDVSIPKLARNRGFNAERQRPLRWLLLTQPPRPVSAALTASLCLRLVLSQAIPPSWVSPSPVQPITFQVRRRHSALEGDRKRKQVKERQASPGSGLAKRHLCKLPACFPALLSAVPTGIQVT